PPHRLGTRRRPAADRAGAPPRGRRPAGHPARPPVRVVAGHAGARPGRAGPPGTPADAPATHARRGTAFHQWLEDRLGQQRLIDTDDLFGGDDLLDGSAEPSPAARVEAEAEADLAALREKFEASDWAGRWPREVEVPFETLIGDRLVRGRIDAVFDDAPDGLIDVVDWKTGQPPGAGPEERAGAVQLAAYRLAWAALTGVPVDRVRAAFHYVRYNRTIRPADLLDEAGLAALIDAIPASPA